MEDRELLFGNYIGKYIRSKRLENHLTLEQLAEKMNSDDKNLGKVERGQKLPSASTLFKLRKALHISLDDLFDSIEKDRDETDTLP